MAEVKIYYKPVVVNYINDLVFQLYEKEYFGFLENAIEYKDKLLYFINENIAIFPRKLTPLTNAHLGSYYIFYLSNKRTTWYVSFEKEDNTYLVTYISNNHNRISKDM